MRTASAVLLTLRRSTCGSCSRRKRAHWASGWGWESTASISSSSSAWRVIRCALHREVVLADDGHRRRVEGEGVEGAAHRALDRVLERAPSARSASPRSHGEDRVVDGRGAQRLELDRPGGLAQGVLGEGPRRPEVGDPHRHLDLFEVDGVAGFVVGGDLLAGNRMDVRLRGDLAFRRRGEGDRHRLRFRPPRCC